MSDAQTVPQLTGGYFRHRDWWAGVGLFMCVVLPFLPAIHGQYTWDDNVYLTENAAVHAWNGLRAIWNPSSTSQHFYPLTYTSFWIEHKLWGLDSTGYHLDNMFFHAAAAFVLWRILQRLHFKTAWIGALIWAIHPIQVESVAWVAERKNPLSALFCFLSALAYLHFKPLDSSAPSPRRWGFYGLALLAFVVGMLAKIAICTLPAGLLLIFWWKDRWLKVSRLWPLIPFFFCAAALAYFATMREKGVIIEGSAPDMVFTWGQRCIIAGKDVWFYLRTLAIPYPSMPVYPRWTYEVSPLNVLAPLSVIALIAALFASRRRIGIGPFLALIFFLVTASPILGFINFYTMHYTFVADHYQYLACLGILIPAVEWAARFAKRIALPRRKFVLASCTAFFVLIFAGLSLFYSSLYQTRVKLWSWTVAHNPTSYIAHQILGASYATEKNLPAADTQMALALALSTDDDSLERMAGLLDLQEKKYLQALDHFQRAIALRPGMGISFMYLGDTCMDMHDLPHALTAFETAIRVANAEPLPYFHYAAALVAAHQSEEAANVYLTGLSLDPGNLTAHYNYANLLLDMDRLPEAITQYQFILKYQENNADAWQNLALAYYRSHQMDQAFAAKRRGNQLDAQAAAATAP